jgi:translation initiation factor 1A
MEYRKPSKFRIPESEESQISRIKLPRGKEIFGVVEQRLGGSRMKVKCLDAKTRITRIPGRLKRSLWVREGDIVIVEPWEFDETKGDILYKYTPTQTGYLKTKGHLKKLEEIQEF